MTNFQPKSKFAISVSLTALASLLAADAAYAQQVPNDEIVVTARKQEQSLQDVPLAITALGALEIQAAGFEDIIDISKAAPGLFIEPINGVSARVQTQPRFRGITFDANSPLQRTATVFVDGVLTSGGIQSIDVNEVERVEIIKGPQSALFGRNTYSGAINYITKDPSADFGGQFSALAATRDKYNVSGGIEGGLIGDTLTGRISGAYNFKGGHFDNAVVDGQELGEEADWNVNATLAYVPTDNFKIKLRGTLYETDDGPAAVIRVAGLAEHNFGGFNFTDPVTGLPGVTETAFRGTIRTPSGAEIGTNTGQADFDRFLSTALADGRAGTNGEGIQTIGISYDDLGGFGAKSEGLRLSANLNYEFQNNLALDILAGYNENEFLLLQDFDASPDLSFTNSIGQEAKDLSLEARLSGSNFEDRLRWSIGGNYLDIDVETVGGFRDEFAFGGLFFPGLFVDRFTTASETIGIFGTLDYDLTDEFTVILEGRYQEDEISDGEPGLIGTSPTTFTNFLPRVLLQYQPSDDATFYASFSQGNLSGGFNPEISELDMTQLAELNARVPGTGLTFGEETLTNYELGWKQTLFNGAAAFNLAGFFMNRKDQIFSGFELIRETPELFAMNGNEFRTVAFTNNGATTDILGFELDGTIKASENLTLQGSLAWIDATIDSFPDGVNSGDFTAVFGPDQNVQGQRAPRFPEWSGSASAAYETPISGNFLGGDANWFTRGDLFYTGEFFDENTNLAENAAAVDVNLRTGIKRDNISVEVFVTNLFQEDSPIGANNIADTSFDVRGFNPFGGPLFDFSRESVHVALRDRRQFGARVDYTF